MDKIYLFRLTYNYKTNKYTREYGLKKYINGWGSLTYNQNIISCIPVENKPFWFQRDTFESVGNLSCDSDERNAHIIWKIDLTGINIKAIKITIQDIFISYPSSINGIINFRGNHFVIKETPTKGPFYNKARDDSEKESEVILELDLKDVKAIDDLDSDLLEVILNFNGPNIKLFYNNVKNNNEQMKIEIEF